MNSLLRLSRYFITKNIRLLSHLVYPEYCLNCERETLENPSGLCVFCEQNLPSAYIQWNNPENILQQLFWGRVKLTHAYAHLSYEKGNPTQALLNRMKYHDQDQLALAMGKAIGFKLTDISKQDLPDVLLPIPLHPKKKFIRGYNQSERLAAGISETLQIPIDETILKKAKHTQSQTKKGRFGRWDNLQNSFAVNNSFNQYEHIALVDDVVTTGATLEKIGSLLQAKNPELRISIFTLAIAQ